jgi:hypothetical protein
VKIFTLGFVIGAALLVSIGAVSAQQHVVKVAYGVNNPPTQFIDSTKNFGLSGNFRGSQLPDFPSKQGVS